jgi:hypothetical protein
MVFNYDFIDIPRKYNKILDMIKSSLELKSWLEKKLTLHLINIYNEKCRAKEQLGL